ncbi:ras-related C3 botulinum toxin substrate 1-like [Planococcus citri]|uniref:ras-related C3 botulinum toxin substrate 1-like n=1 Tax=Planococcus citri TaxID=170843 RepID=UPI0031F7B3AE
MPKVVIVGDECVGKSCLIVTHSTGSFPYDRIPIILSVSSECADENGENRTEIIFYDTFGAQEFDYARHFLYAGADAFLICFSVVDHQSFQSVLTRWYPEVKKNSPNTPIILIGLKSDLTYSTSVTHDQGLSMANSIGAIGYLECSAIAKTGFSELNKLLNSITKRPHPNRSSTSMSIELAETPITSSVGLGNWVMAIILLSLVAIVLFCAGYFKKTQTQ